MQNRPQAGPHSVGSPRTDLLPIVAVTWSPEARTELAARARGRRLMLDYFAARCCQGNVSVGDLHLRWGGSRERIDDFLPLSAPPDVDAYVQRDLVPILTAAGGRVCMRGWGPFRHLAVDLRDPITWQDFVGTCRTRSPLRH